MPIYNVREFVGFGVIKGMYSEIVCGDCLRDEDEVNIGFRKQDLEQKVAVCGRCGARVMGHKIKIRVQGGDECVQSKD